MRTAHVAVIGGDRFRLRRETGCVRIGGEGGPHEFLRRELRRNPRAAGAGVAGRVRHFHRESEACRLSGGVPQQIVELGRAKHDASARQCLFDDEQVEPADADALHRFEVGGDARARDIAVDPVPPDAQAAVVVRLQERTRERIRAGGRHDGSVASDAECRADAAGEHRKQTERRSIAHGVSRFRRRGVSLVAPLAVRVVHIVGCVPARLRVESERRTARR